MLEVTFKPLRSNGETIGIAAFGRDVTERNATAEALRATENNYREIFEGALEGIYRTSPAGKSLLVNPALATMLGYESPEETMNAVQDAANDVWVDPSDRARYAQMLEDSGTILNYEARYRRKDGQIIWVSLNGKKIAGEDGRTLYYEGFIEDITKRKQLDLQLHEKHERLRDAEYLAHIGSSSWDVDTDTTVWSEGLYHITGRQVGSPPPNLREREKLYTKESWECLRNAIERTLATGKPYHLELQIIRPDGSLRWTLAQGTGIRNTEGRIHRVVGTLQDITVRKLAEFALRDSEERFRSTFEQASVGILHVSFEGVIQRCNKQFANMLQYEPNEIVGKTIQQLTPLEFIQESNEKLYGMTPDTSTAFEKAYLRKDGTQTWVRITSSIQRDGKGDAAHLVAFVENIDARKAAEDDLAAKSEELHASETRYRTVFQTTLDPVTITRLSDGIYLDINEAFLTLSGFTREEVVGRNWKELNIWVNPEQRQMIVEGLRHGRNYSNLEVQFRKKNGELLWALTSGSIVEIDGVPCLVGMAHDITHEKESARRIRELAFYDQVTHLPNRRFLLDQIRQISTHDSRKRALLFINMAKFKTVNDSLGHHLGDLLLQDWAGRLSECIRGKGILARLEADEFGVLLEGLHEDFEEAAEQARIVAQNILAIGEAPYRLADHEVHCPPTIGISVFASDIQSSQEALQQSQIALDRANDSDRNRIRFFSPALQAAINTRIAMEDDLRNAIKNGQFSLHFQPQIRESSLVGTEALIRWMHPAKGTIAPGLFIPLAEESGLILDLGEWVLQAACKQLAAWAHREETAHIQIAVNISAAQFYLPDFVDRVLTTIRQTGANPRNLKLELTESSLVENIGDVIQKISELKSHGLTFSVDDFGTGYSSLAYLQRLPIDQLKIDRAFVKDIVFDVASVAIARAIISLSHAMGLSLIAEGIETVEQRDTLLQLGCDTFQGYLYSRPLPVDEFENLWIAAAERVSIPYS